MMRTSSAGLWVRVELLEERGITPAEAVLVTLFDDLPGRRQSGVVISAGGDVYDFALRSGCRIGILRGLAFARSCTADRCLIAEGRNLEIQWWHDITDSWRSEPWHG